MNDFRKARVYVGTYQKYNNGSIDGAWIDLKNFTDKEEFNNACRELHKDEDDLEFMFQDWENIPDELIDEAWISPNVFKLIQAAEADFNSDTEIDAFFVWMNDTNQDYAEDADVLVERFHDAYEGEYASEEDFARHIFDEYGIFDKMGGLAMYFDYDAFARDLFINDYLWDSDYVFRRV